MITRCLCQNCKGAIEFEAERSGEFTSCPHCAQTVHLSIPKPKEPPKQTPPKPRPPSDAELAHERFHEYASALDKGQSWVYFICFGGIIIGLFCCVGSLADGKNEVAAACFSTMVYCCLILGATRIVCGIGMAVIEAARTYVMRVAIHDSDDAP